MHRGKLVAPILVGALTVAWFCFWIAACVSIPEIPLGYKIAGILVPVGLIGVTVFVMAERIKEIRSGEEDDLDNY